MKRCGKVFVPHPLETGEAITMEQSLRDKMVLSPAQIQKACKVGECSPK